MIGWLWSLRSAALEGWSIRAQFVSYKRPKVVLVHRLPSCWRFFINWKQVECVLCSMKFCVMFLTNQEEAEWTSSLSLLERWPELQIKLLLCCWWLVTLHKVRLASCRVQVLKPLKTAVSVKHQESFCRAARHTAAATKLCTGVLESLKLLLMFLGFQNIVLRSPGAPHLSEAPPLVLFLLLLLLHSSLIAAISSSSSSQPPTRPCRPRPPPPVQKPSQLPSRPPLPPTSPTSLLPAPPPSLPPPLSPITVSQSSHHPSVSSDPPPSSSSPPPPAAPPLFPSSSPSPGRLSFMDQLVGSVSVWRPDGLSQDRMSCLLEKQPAGVKPERTHCLCSLMSDTSPLRFC